jgi:hypothetical protein
MKLSKHSAQYVKTTNIRELRYFWWRLTDEGRDPNAPPEPTHPSEYRKLLNEYLSKQNELYDGKAKKIVKELTDDFEAYHLTNEQLDWIDPKDIRLCYWVWSYLRHSVEKLDENSLPIEKKLPYATPGEWPSSDEQKIYEALGLSFNPKNHKSRHENIICFFDYWNASNHKKVAFIEELKRLWESRVLPDDLSWINKEDKKITDWFIRYIKDSELPIQWIPELHSSDEPYHRCIAIIDFYWCFEDPRAKKYFIGKLKKAWYQQKHRAKMEDEDQKAYNFVMGTEIDGFLTALARKAKIPKNRFLEQLITKEYEKKFSD